MFLIELIKRDALFYTSSFILFSFITYYLFQMNQLSLWGDELWTLSRMSTSYHDLIKPGFLYDPNYPLPIAFFKLSAYLLSTENAAIIVLANLVFFIFIFIGFLVIKKYLFFAQSVLLLALMLSSEYFMRMYLELKPYGLMLSLSFLLSCLYVRFYFDREERVFSLTILIGLLLSLVHPLAGLFVCSIFATTFFIVGTSFKRIVLILGICFPIIILLLYSRLSTEGIFMKLTFNHIRNTFAFMIPVLTLFLMFVYFQFQRNFLKIKEALFLYLPVILSISIIYLYSFIVHPLFQARYFTIFLPLTCLVLVLSSSQDFSKIKYPIIITCLISVIFLYGPRSKIPYTNFEDLILQSHYEDCLDAPIFFNNTETPQRKNINNLYIEMYLTASKYYSAKHQRPLETYKKIINSIDMLIKRYPDCRIFGITGQGDQEVFAETMIKDLEERDLGSIFTIEEIKAKNCEKPGCGVLFSITHK